MPSASSPSEGDIVVSSAFRMCRWYGPRIITRVTRDYCAAIGAAVSHRDWYKWSVTGDMDEGTDHLVYV
jgi:hypothetical protein